MSKISYYSSAGLQNLREELQALKGKERTRVAAQLAHARSQGDLSENAEYDAAKEAQALLEAKISKLEEIVANARLLDTTQIDTSKVSILSTVTVLNQKTQQQLAYTLVSEKEANLQQSKISVDSPLGKALLGKKVGQTAVVEAPAGQIFLEVVSVHFAQ